MSVGILFKYTTFLSENKKNILHFQDSCFFCLDALNIV
jgi:hypothetical protein